MPLLNLVPPPREKSPSEKVSPGETHDVSHDSRLYIFHAGEWVRQPNQYPPPRDDILPITGDIIGYLEVPPRDVTVPIQSLRPSTARPLSRSEIHNLQSLAARIKLCVEFSELVSFNPQDYKFTRFGSDVLQNFKLSIVLEPGGEFGDDCLCLIAEDINGDVYVVVRGSTSLSEIQSHLLACSCPPSTEKMYVNERFLRHATNGLGSQIRLNLQRINPQARIYVTGHETGGSIASIIAPLLTRSFPEASVYCVTFGAPIPGDRIFARWIRETVKNHYRIVIDTDVMPLIPASENHCQCSDAICVINTRNDPPNLEVWPESSDSRWTFSVTDVIRSIEQSSLASVHTYCQRICVALANL